MILRHLYDTNETIRNNFSRRKIQDLENIQVLVREKKIALGPCDSAAPFDTIKLFFKVDLGFCSFYLVSVNCCQFVSILCMHRFMPTSLQALWWPWLLFLGPKTLWRLS